jgi:hypothetical protein
MLKFFNALITEYNNVKAPVPYRQDTFAESRQKARAHVKWEQENLHAKMCTMTAHQTDVFKSQFEFWDEWTGCGFRRRTNPAVGVIKKNDSHTDVNSPGGDRAYVPGSICRSNPVTGGWEALVD